MSKIKHSRPGLGPAISITEGVILMTPQGEAVICYRVHKWGTSSIRVETTKDLSLATVNPEYDLAREAGRLLRCHCTRVPVVVERVVRLSPQDFELEAQEGPKTTALDFDPDVGRCEQCGSGSCNGECL